MLKSFSKIDLSILHHIVTELKEVSLPKKELLDYLEEKDTKNPVFISYLNYNEDPVCLVNLMKKRFVISFK